MFKIGDKIICKTEYYRDLKINDIYIVRDFLLHNNGYQILYLNGTKETYYDGYFISLIEERKQKINKIKERICSKSEKN